MTPICRLFVIGSGEPLAAVRSKTDVFGGWELREDGVAGKAVTVSAAGRFLADRSGVVDISLDPGACRDTFRERRSAFRASTSGWLTTLPLIDTRTSQA